MHLLPQTIIEIVSLGGGMIIDLEKNILLSEVMIRIAAAAGHSGATVIFKVGNSVILPQVMSQVAAAGRGRVIFDVS